LRPLCRDYGPFTITFDFQLPALSFAVPFDLGHPLFYRGCPSARRFVGGHADLILMRGYSNFPFSVLIAGTPSSGFFLPFPPVSFFLMLLAVRCLFALRRPSTVFTNIVPTFTGTFFRSSFRRALGFRPPSSSVVIETPPLLALPRLPRFL